MSLCAWQACATINVVLSLSDLCARAPEHFFYSVLLLQLEFGFVFAVSYSSTALRVDNTGMTSGEASSHKLKETAIPVHQYVLLNHPVGREAPSPALPCPFVSCEIL